MNINIKRGLACGEITPPPSKSYAHRLLIGCALSGGGSVSGIIGSEDMKATLRCIEALGVGFSQKNDKITFLFKKERTNRFYCHESGSTLRFFIPLSLVYEGECLFFGTEKLMSRGLSVYTEIFDRQGIEYSLDKECLRVKGQLKPDHFKVRGDISSQFITGLLFALPLLCGDSIVEITTELQSEGYVDITLDVLSRLGIKITREDNKFYIKGNQRYLKGDYSVEADASNSAFLEALNLLGGHVSVLGLNENTLQADYQYKKIFEELKNGTPQIDLSSCPDLGPITFCMAAYFNGATFVGIERLRIKESDRVGEVICELEKMGVKSKVFQDKAIIEGGIHPPSVPLCGHNDHRLVMSLAVLLTALGGELCGCEAVTKSYPHFFEDLKRLGILMEGEN
ncbi:MAG: 3-phosphoshikimate 1-carboxyvinyltransferase [Clostridia bacterium]|nr:3-phosphoshikimate 1-carboxyvinyltransferase [Clostridia bacterium]